RCGCARNAPEPRQATTLRVQLGWQAIRARNGDLQPLSHVSCNRGQHPLHASGLPVSPMREEQPGIARRAEVEALDLRDAGPTQRSLGRLPEVELPAPRDPGAEAPAVGDRDLLADLV